jgi:oligosaccharide repeat unit polymerase
LSLIFGILIVFQKLKKKHLFYAFSGFLILFSTVGILLNNGGSTENNLEENISGLAGNFMIYLLGSLSAFDAFIHSNYIITYGENSFRFIYSVLYKIGSLESKPSELVDQYVSIPFDTNVYTLYKIYFQDFGILFMMLVVFCMSLLHTYYYLKAINGRQFMPTFIYSVMLYPLFMSFFQEQYLSLMPTWIYFIFIALVVKLFLVEKGALIE